MVTKSPNEFQEARARAHRADWGVPEGPKRPAQYVRTCPACRGDGTIVVRNNYWGRDEERPCTTCSQTGQLKCSAYAEGARRVSEWERAG